MNKKIILLFLGMLIILFYFIFIVDVQRYRVNANFGDHLGFNLDNDAIYFGTLIIGTEAKKSITIYNSNNYTVKVRNYLFGDLNKYVFKTNNKSYLEPYEYYDMELVAKSDGSIRGAYNSTLIIFFTRF